jgi:hypothetical protein
MGCVLTLVLSHGASIPARDENAWHSGAVAMQAVHGEGVRG